jgi:hypothetical protein
MQLQVVYQDRGLREKNGRPHPPCCTIVD